MNYAKPAITLIDAAKSAIQGVRKSGGPQDSFTEPITLVNTINVYQADE
ncbi:MAG: hypothetical protein WBE13_03620 [Candidatus Acidiferrum sp.]